MRNIDKTHSPVLASNSTRQVTALRIDLKELRDAKRNFRIEKASCDGKRRQRWGCRKFSGREVVSEREQRGGEKEEKETRFEQSGGNGSRWFISEI